MSFVRLPRNLVGSIVAVCLVAGGTPVFAANGASPSDPPATPKKKVKTKLVCTYNAEGKRVCKKVAAADANVGKSSSFLGSPAGVSTLLGTTAVTAAAVNYKNCGKGNNNNTGGGTNNGNCASP